MKSLVKRIGALTAAVAVLTAMMGGTGLIFGGYASADDGTDYAYKYYYAQLSDNPMAERFYGAFEALASSGEFKKGKISYDLIANNVVSSAEAAAYVNGTDNNRLAKAYGAGRDAFYMDHPDMFYADMFSTSISAGQKGNEYVAFLDSSRVLTVYTGELDTEAEIDAAIAAYNGKIAEIVAEAEKLDGAQAKIAYVNKYIADHNSYGFGTRVENGRNVDTPKAAYVYTSYGALINNESVCEGYAKSFKAVMDRLGIPCVCVQGYADGSGNGDYEPHMWNKVELDGMWYAVDVTYNATGSSLNKWMLLGEQSVFHTHIEDGSVSSSGYELRYPALKPYDYGTDSDENGMLILGSYFAEGSYDDDGSYIAEESSITLKLLVSYDGKGAYKLEEEGKYLAYRQGSTDDDSVLQWDPWFNCVEFKKGNGMVDITDFDTSVYIYPGTEYVQFALMNYAPDANINGGAYPDSPEYGDDAGKPWNITYSPETEAEDDFFFEQPSTPYRNNGYLSYIPAPIAFATPANTADLPVDSTYDIRLVYTDTLVIADGATAEDVGIDFVTSRGNDTVKEHAVLENFHWDGDKTITFTFTPSKMYIHNLATYYFTPVNLVGEKSKKVPDSVSYAFKGKSVVCSKVFNDGRLYMNVFGQPTLLDNSDVSVTDFKDESGNYYAASQRSQLVLVASKPTSAQEREMDETLKRDTGVKDDEIIASASYQIDLQICGFVHKIPNGSYMQVAFGFPEGYSADDAGTTFKIYHYKHDDLGNITGVEEIPAIITEYGLIARVSSFSPFTIVQIKNSSAAVANDDKVNVYAYVNGETGGTVTTEGKSGITEVSGASITYDITAAEGYTVGSVKLNGKVIDSSYYQNGKLTLAKNDIDSSNMLEVTFVTEESANAYAAQGITISHGIKSDYTPSDYAPPKSNVVGIVVGCVVGAIVLAGGAFAAWWFLVKNKKRPAAKTASASASSKSPTTAKTSAAKSRTTAKHATTASKTAPSVHKSAPMSARPSASASQQHAPRTANARQTEHVNGKASASAERPTNRTVSPRPSSRPTPTASRPTSATQRPSPTPTKRPQTTSAAPKTTKPSPNTKDKRN